jgi:hypothetical protein
MDVEASLGVVNRIPGGATMFHRVPPLHTRVVAGGFVIISRELA